MNLIRRTVLGMAAAAALAPAAALAQDTIKVGEINHYKRMAAFAEPYKKGIELALSQINGDGGVLGKDLEFVFRDDQGDPAEAVKIAEGFDDVLGLSGVILTKMDGDARGGAALSIRGVVGKPIKFVGVGETVDDLELTDPDRIAGRILKMGDVVGLVERAERALDPGAHEELQQQMLKGGFTLEDFLTAMRQVQKMGPVEQLLKMIPGGAKAIPAGGLDPRRMKHVEAIILSMTKAERSRPEILDGSRRARIAKGSGRPVSEVNRLLKQFKETQEFMKQMRGMLPV